MVGGGTHSGQLSRLGLVLFGLRMVDRAGWLRETGPGASFRPGAGVTSPNALRASGSAVEWPPRRDPWSLGCCPRVCPYPAVGLRNPRPFSGRRWTLRLVIGVGAWCLDVGGDAGVRRCLPVSEGPARQASAFRDLEIAASGVLAPGGAVGAIVSSASLVRGVLENVSGASPPIGSFLRRAVGSGWAAEGSGRRSRPGTFGHQRAFLVSGRAAAEESVGRM